MRATFVGVQKIGRLQRPKCLGHLGPPNESKLRFSTILCKSFLCVHISLALYAHWSYFKKCVQYGHQRLNFRAILYPKVSQNAGFWSLSQKVFAGLTPVLIHMLIASTFSGVWNMASKAQFWDDFWPLNKSKFRYLVILKNFSLVSHQYCFSCSLQVLSNVWRIWASDVQF